MVDSFGRKRNSTKLSTSGAGPNGEPRRLNSDA